jgi:hypothetical protein
VRKFFLSGISFFVSFILSAQTVSRFPIIPSSTWRVDSIDAMWQVFEKTRYFIQGDTLISSQGYYKLFKSGVAYYDTPFYYDNIYVGAIREEDNRIFFINKGRSAEIWLYDFKLQVGDTIKAEVAKGQTILSIDTLPDGRRIYNYDLGHNTTGFLIEGIGTNGGLLAGGTSFIPIHSGQCACFLICYAGNGQLVYQNTPGIESNCEIVHADHRYTINPKAKWKVMRDIDNETLVDQIIIIIQL